MFWMYNQEIIGIAGRLSAIYGSAYELGPSEQRVLQSIISWCINNKTDTFIKNQVFMEDKAGITQPGFNKISRRLQDKNIIANTGRPMNCSGKVEICRLTVSVDKLLPVARDLKSPAKKEN